VQVTNDGETPTQSDQSLTPGQQEVAALIARGLTNSQIAERLVVSPTPSNGTWKTSSTGCASRRGRKSRSGWSNAGVSDLPYFRALGDSHDVAASARAYRVRI